MDLFYSSFAFIVAFVTAIYFFLTKNYDYWKKQNIPYLPNPTLFFGHMLSVITVRENTAIFASRVYESTKASMIGFYFMRKPALIIRDPELIRSVLQTNFSSFRATLMSLDEKNDPVMAKHPFFTEEPDLWKERRSHISNHLTGKKLRRLFVYVQNVCEKTCEFVDRKIQENNGLYECQLKQFFAKCTGEVVANTAFGIEGQSFKDDPDSLSFTRIAGTIFTPTLINGIKQTLLFFLPEFASFFHLKFMPDHADAYFRQNLKAIIEKRNRENDSTIDYLRYSLDSNAKDDIDSIIADIVNFYIDVYETSSSVLAHLFYYLSKEPEVQTKLRKDLMAIEQITYESLKEMNYLDQVMNESMRLSAPLGVQMKRCTRVKIKKISARSLRDVSNVTPFETRLRWLKDESESLNC